MQRNVRYHANGKNAGNPLRDLSDLFSPPLSLSLARIRIIFQSICVKCPHIRLQCVSHMCTCVHTYIANTRDRCSIYARWRKPHSGFVVVLKISLACLGCHPAAVAALIWMRWYRWRQELRTTRFSHALRKRSKKALGISRAYIGDNPSDRLILLCREADCIVLPIIFPYFKLSVTFHNFSLIIRIIICKSFLITISVALNPLQCEWNLFAISHLCLTISSNILRDIFPNC